MPFDLSEVVLNPDFAQDVTITRSSGSFGEGGWINTSSTIYAKGTIVVADSRALQQIPEGDRVVGSMQLLIDIQIYETSAARGGLSDQIVWRGDNYRVQKVDPWGDFGFWSAILVRMEGA